MVRVACAIIFKGGGRTLSKNGQCDVAIFITVAQTRSEKFKWNNWKWFVTKNNPQTKEKSTWNKEFVYPLYAN